MQKCLHVLASPQTREFAIIWMLRLKKVTFKIGLQNENPFRGCVHCRGGQMSFFFATGHQHRGILKQRDNMTNDAVHRFSIY